MFTPSQALRLPQDAGCGKSASYIISGKSASAIISAFRQLPPRLCPQITTVFISKSGLFYEYQKDFSSSEMKRGGKDKGGTKEKRKGNY